MKMAWTVLLASFVAGCAEHEEKPRPERIHGGNFAVALSVARGTGEVYWAEGPILFPGGSIHAYSPTAGHRVVAELPGPIPLEIAADSAHVYWPSEATLTRGNGGVTVLSELAAPLRGIAVADGWVYVTRAGDLVRVAASGGDEQLVAPSVGDVRALATDGAHVFLLLDAGIDRVPCDGGEPQRIALLAHATDFALDATHVYASTADAVWRAKKTGGEPTVLVERGAYEIDVDDGHVYAASYETVFRFAKSGGKPDDLAAVDSPFDLAISSDAIYWSDALDVYRLAK